MTSECSGDSRLSSFMPACLPVLRSGRWNVIKKEYSGFHSPLSVVSSFSEYSSSFDDPGVRLKVDDRTDAVRPDSVNDIAQKVIRRHLSAGVAGKLPHAIGWR